MDNDNSAMPGSVERQYDISAKRKWICPSCKHERPRHHAKKTRPFCAPCEFQHAVLIEMEPYKQDEKVSLDG